MMNNARLARFWSVRTGRSLMDLRTMDSTTHNLLFLVDKAEKRPSHIALWSDSDDFFSEFSIFFRIRTHQAMRSSIPRSVHSFYSLSAHGKRSFELPDLLARNTWTISGGCLHQRWSPSPATNDHQGSQKSRRLASRLDRLYQRRIFVITLSFWGICQDRQKTILISDVCRTWCTIYANMSGNA